MSDIEAKVAKMLDNIYNDSVWSLSYVCSELQTLEGKYNLSDYPQLEEKVNAILDELNARSMQVINSGVNSAWALSNVKNNALVSVFFQGKLDHLTDKMKEMYNQQNLGALDGFLRRKTNGLNLSDRVWHYTNKYKSDIENALQIGIGNGVSADKMSEYMLQFLRNPSATILEVDKNGIFKEVPVKSQGPGIYKDPKANAMRLARTETNMAYRTADQVRWSQLDFVVGYEVHLSHNHTTKKNGKVVRFVDVCDFLQGKYPKDFRFAGWHPNCRCYSTPILKTEAEMDRDDEILLMGGQPSTESKNTITEPPAGFKKWTLENADRIARSKSLPYFVRDNAEYFKGIEFNSEQRKQLTER